MNPFDWRGPEFLAFYAILGATILAAIALRRRFFEPRAPVRERLTDPSAIAYLRAGRKEPLRLAVLSLLERGLLRADGACLEAKDAPAPPALSALERGILEKFEKPGEARKVFKDDALGRECRSLRGALESDGLLPDAGQRWLRLWSTLAGIGVLVLVAGIKIQLALERGKTNVLFLIVLAIVFCLGAVALALLPRTPRGTTVLRDLQQLLGLARRRSQGASGAELALLAATFGVGALVDPTHASRVERIFPKGSSSSYFGCGSGCGSVGGWSSCGAGSSSCGGGGSSCGGGCGGCGS